MPLSAAIGITGATVRALEDGPPLAGDAEFTPGEMVYYSFQVTGYGASPLKVVRLSYRIEALDPQGVRIELPVESILDTTVADQDKEWKPKIRTAIGLPALAPSGIYKVRAKVMDDISHGEAESEITFKVAGHNVEPSADLTVRNFGFYRSEDAVGPVEIAAFRPGDTLFARFDITGFRHGDRNAISVTYDLAVINGAGKTIYTQMAAAAEKSESFYPKRWVPMGLSLNLEPTMRPGDYTILITAHDLVGLQDFESRQTFHLE